MTRTDTGSNTAAGFANTSLNVTDLTVSGTNRAVVAALTCDDDVDHNASATWNGVAGTRIHQGTTVRYLAVFLWAAELGNEPATGNQTLAFSWTSGSLPLAIGVAYEGVSGSDAADTPVTDANNEGAITVTGSTEPGDLLAVFATENNTTALSSPTNVTQVLSITESSQAVLVYGESTGSGSVSPTWTGSGFDDWRVTAVNLNAGVETVSRPRYIGI